MDHSQAGSVADQDEIPREPERDQYGGDDLPTYDDLAVQHGPNSRFGRWKEWIEKRAAERYADLTPEALARRRQKGWGESIDNVPPPASGPTSNGEAGGSGSSPYPSLQLHIQTDFSNPTLPVAPPTMHKILPPTPSMGETLAPTHLQIHQFGSRFLPHTTTPIRCLLPLLNDRMLLIGHDEGLSVMDMYPKEWSEHGLLEKGPNDAQTRPIWIGEGVYQMNVLEAESTGEGTPQGVVLALVGPNGESPKDHESVRALRMYNLASLVSLARWAISQKGGRPLDLRHSSTGKQKQSQTTPKKHHRKGPSLARGLRNLVADAPITPVNSNPPQVRLDALYSDSPLDPPPSLRSVSPIYRTNSNDSSSTVDSSWDVVDEMPLRWATDFVPLASSGSRLQHSSVLFYSLWRDENQRSRGGVYLAIVVKNNIFLYETPKGERAFRFVKEFYTPLTARSVAFVQQAVQDPMSRSTSDVSPRLGSHQHHHRHTKQLSMTVAGPSRFSQQYPPQLTLFVIFEKKAGMIRIADSAVGEVELSADETSQLNLLAPLGGSTGSRRSRSSWDGKGFLKESKASWGLPVKFLVPGYGKEKALYVLTRGKQSHLYPHPLPANLSVTPSFRTFVWSSVPSFVCPRVVDPAEGSPYLQVIAFGDEGVEVIELLLSSLTENKGKGKAVEDTVRAQSDLGGSDTGFLCAGGHWDKSRNSPELVRSDSTKSIESDYEVCVPIRTDLVRGEEGVYGWVRKGQEDWRVFWVGGGAQR
ncbi:hypothetical protein K474DRAFT_1655296 [Panus rudis PR-1116 ss-1]|nr:hypothetical protein K474DRAFT_1655296 [Panus rudis PR-1116 ss-1]